MHDETDLIDIRIFALNFKDCGELEPDDNLGT